MIEKKKRWWPAIFEKLRNPFHKKKRKRLRPGRHIAIQTSHALKDGRKNSTVMGRCIHHENERHPVKRVSSFKLKEGQLYETRIKQQSHTKSTLDAIKSLPSTTTKSTQTNRLTPSTGLTHLNTTSNIEQIHTDHTGREIDEACGRHVASQTSEGTTSSEGERVIYQNCTFNSYCYKDNCARQHGSDYPKQNMCIPTTSQTALSQKMVSPPTIPPRPKKWNTILQNIRLHMGRQDGRHWSHDSSPTTLDKFIETLDQGFMSLPRDLSSYRHLIGELSDEEEFPEMSSSNLSTHNPVYVIRKNSFSSSNSVSSDGGGAASDEPDNNKASGGLSLNHLSRKMFTFEKFELSIYDNFSTHNLNHRPQE